jgi:hypothetical protein
MAASDPFDARLRFAQQLAQGRLCAEQGAQEEDYFSHVEKTLGI